MDKTDLGTARPNRSRVLSCFRFQQSSIRRWIAPSVIVAASLWQAACTNGMAAADSNTVATPLTAENCANAIPSLQQAAYGDGSGHREALEMLASCYDQLGQADRATAARWRLYEDNTDY
jgi:hypothetical protein